MKNYGGKIVAEKYSCKYCGTEIDWESDDEHKGSIWSCEDVRCGELFCRQCFIDKYGVDSFLHMVNEEDIIRCPDCYEKYLKETENK